VAAIEIPEYLWHRLETAAAVKGVTAEEMAVEVLGRDSELATRSEWAARSEETAPNATDGTFQVDLSGVVDLLSNHLYSGPSVFVRELLQNAVDAVEARRLDDPAFRGSVRLEVVAGDVPTLVVEDDGIGLTTNDVAMLLSTVGRSSKRDELSFARSEFIGQFGVGLLSAFLVSDEVVAISTSVRDPAAPTVEWRGRSDGTYSVRELDRRGRGGTRMFLRARPDMAEWITFARVSELARRYGQHLPVTIEVHGGGVVERIDEPFLWEQSVDGADLLEQGSQVLGRELLDVVEIGAPVGGVRGLAFVLAESPGPHARPQNVVYLKRMLLGEDIDELLPDWAFFVTCIVEADELTPTASREALQDNEALRLTRAELGAALKATLVTMAERDPQRLGGWVRVHHLAMKALAAIDDEFLDVIGDWLPMETTRGRIELGQLLRDPTLGEVRVTRTVDTFRQVAPIASSQGLVVVNGGYSYDRDIMFRLPRVRPEVTVTEITADELLTSLSPVLSEDEAVAGVVKRAADQALRDLSVQTVVRRFEPWSLPALFVASDDDRYLRQLRSSAESSTPLFGGIAAELATGYANEGPRLCLNLESPLVRSLGAIADRELLARGIELLYIQALLLGHHPLSTGDLGLLNASLIGLLGWSIDRALGDDS
jgi:molecular chaperone HtpG